jgi:2-keto-3-deoxy-L-rhamnonate aldolase RhmA
MNDPTPTAHSFREHLLAESFLVGTWLTIMDPTVPELLAGSGFDFFIADGEHGPIATSDLVTILVATRAAGVPVLHRVGANEPVRIMHALDAGASGVVIPRIRSVADAEHAASWCRYPPRGTRGYGPRRAAGYGRQNARYLEAADSLVTCCIQIETREALEDLDSILAVPGVDAALIGPNDLAAALGHIGDLGHEEVEAAIASVEQRARQAGVPAGIWTPSVEVASRRREQGFRFVTVSSDYGFMAAAADAAVSNLRPHGGQRTAVRT